MDLNNRKMTNNPPYPALYSINLFTKDAKKIYDE